MQNIQGNLGSDSLFSVELFSQSDGIASPFMKDFQINVLFSIKWMIDIEAIIGGIKFFMTCL